jgi:hypothetical protein
MFPNPLTPTRTRVSVTDPLSPVRVSPVRVNGSAVPHQGIEILTDEGDWECINIHSSSYSLVPNAEMEKTSRMILAASGMCWEPTSEVWTGRYWAKLFKADFSVEAPRVGDALSLGLRVENSYDGSCQFRLCLMAYVLSCTNGLVSPRHFSTYKMRHTVNNEFDIQEAVTVIRSGMDQVMNILPLVDRLSEIRLTVPFLSTVCRETDLPSGEWGLIVKDLGGAKTAWDLFQSITGRLTHHGRGRSGLLQQEQVGDYFLHRLAA